MFIELNAEVYRILKEQPDGAWAICCDTPSAPVFVGIAELQHLRRVPAPPCFRPGSRMTEKQAARLAHMAPLLEDECCITDAKHRNHVVEAVAATCGVTPRSIKRTYYKYLANGSFGRKRPVSREASPGGRPIMRQAIMEDHYSARKPSLRDTYDLMLLKHFTDADGSICSDAPTLSAFRHFYYRGGYHKRSQKFIARDGLEHYQRNTRPLSGSSSSWKNRLGAYQVDATTADIHLVAERDRSRVVGRPNVFLCVDTATQLIAGVYVGFAGGEQAAMACIANAAADKVAFCQKYGIDITPEQWPSRGLPAEIISDQGSEFVNGRRDELCLRYGITWDALPPFRPDEKGSVEKSFDLLQARYKPILRGCGVIDGQTVERWSTDYRQQAALTLTEFTQVILHCIVHLNADRVLRSVQLTPEMLAAKVTPTPAGLWQYYKATGRTRLMETNEEEVYRIALPRERVKLTRSGIKFHHLRYVNPSFARSEEGELLRGQDVTVAYDPENTGVLYLVLPDCYVPFELESSLGSYNGLPIAESELLHQASREAVLASALKERQSRVHLLREIQSIRDHARKGDETT